MLQRELTDLSYLSRPSDSFSVILNRRVQRRHSLAWVHGAFPVVMASRWRHRVADAFGFNGFIPGRPMIAAAIGSELWLYSSDEALSIGRLTGIYSSAAVGTIDDVEKPTFAIVDRPFQLGVDWFDDARYALARMRRG